MTILQLVPKDDPILKKKLEPFDWLNPQADPIEVAKDLTETMLSHNGLGLAANQVGLKFRVFVMKSSPIICAFNPIIVDRSEEQIYLDEGCLSYKNLFIKIKRPKAIRVRFAKPNGDVDTYKFEGMTARIFQHELDHLDGITFQTRATKYHLELARNKAKKA